MRCGGPRPNGTLYKNPKGRQVRTFVFLKVSPGAGMFTHTYIHTHTHVHTHLYTPPPTHTTWCRHIDNQSSRPRASVSSCLGALSLVAYRIRGHNCACLLIRFIFYYFRCRSSNIVHIVSRRDVINIVSQ